ncbi:hypothetical protein ACVWYH_005880 [Bradyrhizobium sp. GM24.11]
MSRTREKSRGDLYARITDRIIAELERGVRPWVQPWTAAKTADRITRPLRHNGQPYTGINVLLLWSEAVARGFCSPIWMTFKQANELGAHVRKGETGSTVVYMRAASPRRRPTLSATKSNGISPSSKPIPSSASIKSMACPRTTTVGRPSSHQRSSATRTPTLSLPTPARLFGTAARRHFIRPRPITFRCRRSKVFATRPPMSPSEPMRPCTGPLPLTASIAISAVTARIGANARAKS